MAFWILIGGLLAAAAYIWIGRRLLARKDEAPVSIKTHPYRAVTVLAGRRACKAAWNLADQRYLASDPPPLPLPGCSTGRCTCHYEYHDDRRDPDDRRGPGSAWQRGFLESDIFISRERNDRRQAS